MIYNFAHIEKCKLKQKRNYQSKRSAPHVGLYAEGIKPIFCISTSNIFDCGIATHGIAVDE